MGFLLEKSSFTELDYKLNISITISKPSRNIQIAGIVESNIHFLLNAISIQYEKKLASNDISDILHSTKLKDIENEFQQQLNKKDLLLKSLIEDNEKVTKEKTNLILEYEQKIQDLTTKMNSTYNEQMNYYKTLSEQLNSKLQTIELTHNEELSEIKEENLRLKKDTHIQKLEYENEKLILKNDYQSEIKKLQNEYSNILSNASKKGKLSETTLIEYLKTIYNSANGYNLFSVGKDIPQLCDIVLYNTRNNTAILIENKAYNRSVPTDEVNKFIRDVKEPNIQAFSSKYSFDLNVIGGIMLARGSSIINKRDMEYEIINDRFVFYLGNYENELEKIQTTISIIEALNKNTNLLDQYERLENINTIVDLIDEIKVDRNIYNKIITTLHSLIEQMNNLKNKSETYREKLAKIHKSIDTNAEEHEYKKTNDSLKNQLSKCFSIDLNSQLAIIYDSLYIDIAHYIKEDTTKMRFNYLFDGAQKNTKYSIDNRETKLLGLVKKLVLFYDIY